MRDGKHCIRRALACVAWALQLHIHIEGACVVHYVDMCISNCCTRLKNPKRENQWAIGPSPAPEQPALTETLPGQAARATQTGTSELGEDNSKGPQSQGGVTHRHPIWRRTSVTPNRRTTTITLTKPTRMKYTRLIQTPRAEAPEGGISPNHCNRHKR